MVPFQMPTSASLDPVPIRLTTGPADDDIPAEIVFLGDNHLWFRVSEAVVYSDEPKSQRGKSSRMIKFAGIRETEAEVEERKQIRAEPRSPKYSVAMPLLGLSPYYVGGYE